MFLIKKSHTKKFFKKEKRNKTSNKLTNLRRSYLKRCSRRYTFTWCWGGLVGPEKEALQSLWNSFIPVFLNIQDFYLNFKLLLYLWAYSSSKILFIYNLYNNNKIFYLYNTITKIFRGFIHIIWEFKKFYEKEFFRDKYFKNSLQTWAFPGVALCELPRKLCIMSSAIVKF